ncbi:uncharacterized protein ACIB01_013468 isoform 1-T2 [Guaruba guarouba]
MFFPLSSEGFVSQPVVQIARWGLSRSISPRGADAVTAFAVLCHSRVLEIALKKLHMRAVMSCPGRTTKGFRGAGTPRMSAHCFLQGPKSALIYSPESGSSQRQPEEIIITR